MSLRPPDTTTWSWRFSADARWSAAVATAPSNDHPAKYFQAAVPALGARGALALSGPVVVVGRITAQSFGRPPGGPVGRAKTFLDALHG